MRRAGHKYPLIVYQHMLNRWWPAMITMGLGLFVLAYTEYIDPLGHFITWRWQLLIGVGALAIFIGLFFLVIRYAAYVQPTPTYLKLVTPFFRINISYKRIKRVSPTEMYSLFPPRSLSGWMQDIFEPLAGKTGLVLELSGYPISPTLLRMFLSRFFFKDNTPHLVILVRDWMSLSAELDSLRTDTGPRPSEPRKRTKDSILSRLPGK
jgi:hypothetical protein